MGRDSEQLLCWCSYRSHSAYM